MIGSGPDAVLIECESCGEYMFTGKGIGDPFYSVTHLHKELIYKGYEDDLYLLRGYIANHHRRERGGTVPGIPYNKDEFGKLMQSLIPFKDLQKKIDFLLLDIKNRSTYYGEKIHYVYDIDFPLFYLKNKLEFQMILQDLHDDGLIFKFSDQPVKRGEKSHSGIELKLNRKGLDFIKERNPSSNQIFVAMKFNKKGKIKLPEIYEKIKNKIEEKTGFSLSWMGLGETKTHTNKICDEIVVQIRKSRFLIADITHENLNVMYEAGYAKGLGMDVLWACEDNTFSKMNSDGALPIDTRQYQYERWKKSDFDEYAKRIISFINSRYL